MNKLLSIIIASYNTKDLTASSINSILNLKTNLDYEIIVVDDASSDGSVEAINKIADRVKEVKLLVNPKNLGYVGTNNRGIKEACGKYILLLNSDTVVKSGALEALVDFAQNNSDAGIVGPRLLNADGSVQPSVFHLPTFKNAVHEYFLGKRGLFEKYAPKGNNPSEVEALVGAAFLITPQALKTVGMLNPAYKSYFEDMDYCRQVGRNGLKVYYLPGAEIIHYHGMSFSKLADEKNRWRKLIPSSKIYHGVFKHYLINFVIWLGQKCASIKKILSG